MNLKEQNANTEKGSNYSIAVGKINVESKGVSKQRNKSALQIVQLPGGKKKNIFLGGREV